MALNRIVQPSDLTQGRLRVDIKKEIDKLDYDQTPLMTLLNHIGKDPASQMKFEWLKKERKVDWGGIVSYGGAWLAGAATTGTITVTLGEGWMYGEGDLIQVPETDQTNIYVDSVAGDVITARSYDNTTTIDFSAGVTGANKLLNMGNAFGLGSGKGTLKNYQPTPDYNYCQIIQSPYGVVHTSNFVEYDAGGIELKETEEDAWIDHNFNKEKTAFFGQRHLASPGYMSTDGTNFDQYMTGGLYEAISTNPITGAVISEPTLTYQEFSDWIALWTRYAKNPVVFAGEIIYGALPFWLKQDLQTRQDESTLGIAITNFRTIYGQEVKVIAHRDLLINAYSGYAFGVDLNDVKYKYLQGNDTHLEKDIQLPDRKQLINEYRSWFGMMVGNSKRHGMIKDVTTINA
jgi:hypothetical protein